MADNNEAVLIGVIQDILNANTDFRAGMPEDWDGDPLQDACDAARFLLIRMGVPLPVVAAAPQVNPEARQDG